MAERVTDREFARKAGTLACLTSSPPPKSLRHHCVCPYSIIAAFVYKYTRSCCANSEPVRLATQFGGVGLRRFDLERTVPQLPRGGGSHSVVNTPREAVRRAYHVPLTESMGPARRRDVSRVRYFALFRTEPCTEGQLVSEPFMVWRLFTWFVGRSRGPTFFEF